MRMLKLYAADQFRNFVPGTERSWPVGHRQASIVAGDKRARDDQKESPTGEKDSEPVMTAIVGCRDGFQSAAPWVRKIPRDVEISSPWSGS